VLRAADADAGVVDQDVDAAERRRCAGAEQARLAALR